MEVAMNLSTLIRRYGALFSVVVLLSACDKGHWDDAGENWKRSTASEVSGIIQTQTK
jgi:hypothetical protein